MIRPQIIVYGLDAIGYRIFRLLRQQQAAVLGVHHTAIPHEPEILVGPLSSAQTLEQAQVQTAQTIVIAHHDDSTNLEILLQVRLLNPNIRIINRLFNQSLGDRLDRTLLNHSSMSVSELSAPIFAFAAMGKVAIGHLQLFQQIWPIYEEIIHPHHPWRERPIREIWADPTRMFIHYLTSDVEISLVEAMSLERRLRVGDQLIIGIRPHVERHQVSLVEILKKSGAWLGQFQRHLRSGLVVTISLLLTIAVATLAYTYFGWKQSTIVDALYFSVGMITGAGGNEDIAEQASATIKIFTVVMMLVGAGVIGVFYALLNDLVLGSRLRQFWDVTRIPQRNHYIICGLGGVGVKTAQQLLRQGHKVVVIERDAKSRFLSMARSQQIPVIVADAKLPVTLKTANIEKASALLAVTHEDMINLEIALTAKELIPSLPLIVRSNHPEQANRMSQVFDFTAVLNPFEIAAPSFAAAALGGQVLGSGVTGQSLWIALSLLITPAHPFCGKAVQVIAIEADLVPLYLQTPNHRIHGWALLEAILNPDDILHLTIPAKNIERLWKTENKPYPV